MSNTKMIAGSHFPAIRISTLSGGEIDLATPLNGHDWRLVVVYRGRHCPKCTAYLSELNDKVSEFNALGVDVIAVSGDPREKAQEHMEIVNPDYLVGYALTIEQMQHLGLYISHPRSPQVTDRPFPEPGLFVINEEGCAQIIDISNAPFARPDLSALIGGINFIRDPEKNYPVRGTYS